MTLGIGTYIEKRDGIQPADAGVSIDMNGILVV
jgi:hypothetical protein